LRAHLRLLLLLVLALLNLPNLALRPLLQLGLLLPRQLRAVLLMGGVVVWLGEMMR